MAGGGPTAGVESGEYNLTAFAKQGDLGIHLPEVHSATWKAGGTAETAWYIRANHGGGYVRKARTEQQTTDVRAERMLLAMLCRRARCCYCCCHTMASAISSPLISCLSDVSSVASAGCTTRRCDMISTQQAFRLCKKEGGSSCTEEGDFLKLPYLKFVATKLRWNDGTEENITGTYITEGTYPQGSSTLRCVAFRTLSINGYSRGLSSAAHSINRLPCLALPCLALPCLALPCLALPCLALPCLALPCLALPSCLAFGS
jgi:hypothetical protein